MKRRLEFIIILGITAAFIHADVYIRQRVHTDSYYYSGVTTPAVDHVNEMWIGESKMALMTKNRVTILDMDHNRAFILIRNSKTYLETTLPLDLFKLVPEQLTSFLQANQYIGTVKDTGKTKKIGKWNCRVYEINSYIQYQEDRLNESDTTLWVSTDVPFDLKKYNDMNTNLHKLENFSDPFCIQLKKIKGFGIARESLFYIKGFSVKSTAAVIDITRRAPPPGTYSLPPGYTKKEALSLEDLINQ